MLDAASLGISVSPLDQTSLPTSPLILQECSSLSLNLKVWIDLCTKATADIDEATD